MKQGKNKDFQKKQQKCFWGNNNMMDQPWKRQANSKQLIANMYLHHYMNHVMKTYYFASFSPTQLTQHTTFTLRAINRN